MDTDTRAAIAKLNDQFRHNPDKAGGKICVTRGAHELMRDYGTRHEVFLNVFMVDKFDFDPYSERDFRAFQVGDHKLFWEIDYYDKSMEFGSPDPSDPEKTTRVLTIMLAEEY